MPQIISTNIAALNTQRNLNTSQSQGLVAQQRLSSGLRINSARDDAAGLSISTRFTAQTRGLEVAIRNAGDGIALAQTAEGALAAMVEGLHRIRDLALQSANGVNTGADRQALNAEVQELIDEVDRIGSATNFNGSPLLDGSLDTSVQIGIAKDQTLGFRIASVRADVLGDGAAIGVSAVGDPQPLASADLVLNGVAIGASRASDDSASTNNAAASAIAKAAAVNRHQDATGVRAQVTPNLAVGTAQVAADLTGSVTLNGVEIATAVGGMHLASDRASVVNAINSKSELTGVQAVDSGTDLGGVQLVAEDGRNIEISFDTVTPAATGLPGAGTYEGGYTLLPMPGVDEIDVSGGEGVTFGNLANAGLQPGRYPSEVASVVTLPRTADTAASVRTMADGDIVINGVPVGGPRAIDDSASNNSANTSLPEGSGIAAAAAINRISHLTGVTAEPNPTIVLGGTSTFTLPAGRTGSVHVNGLETRDITTSGDRDVDRVTAISAINELTGQTGVIATDNGISITLTAPDGRNVTVAVDHRGIPGFDADIGLRATQPGIAAGNITGFVPYNLIADTTYSSVTLTSDLPIDVRSGDGASESLSDIGFLEGVFGGGLDGGLLADVDISTLAGAEAALVIVDNALETVSNERSQLGALQNRLDTTVNALAVASEHVSVANSRIRDADFARETAALSRTQVLQQAGISILAQANAQPQLVIALLQQS